MDGFGSFDYASLLPEDEPLALGPPADDDYREADKPVLAAVKANADDLLAEHALRIGQAREYRAFLSCETPGHFKEDRPLIDDDIIETMPLLGEREAFDFRCGFLAGHQLAPRLLNRDALDRDEAMAIEDLVTYDFQTEERQYSRRYGADLRWDEAAHLLGCGALVGLDVLDPNDRQSGLAMSLIDPLTVFPVWGGPHGLVEVYRVYEDTNDNIVGAYGGKPGSREYERIARTVKNSASTTKYGRRTEMARDELRTVIECWNRDHLVVVLDDDIELLHRKHGYHRLPFTIRLGAFDQPAGVTVGSAWRHGRVETISSDWGPGGSVTVSGRAVDLARQWRPYAWRHVWAHRIAEAVAGRRLSIFKWAIDPHKVLEYDPSAEYKMAKEVDLTPGETTKIPLPGKLNLITPVFDPNVMAGLAADLQANVGGGFLTQARLGNVPPQTSGSALGKMASLGGAAETVLVRALQSYKRDRAEWRLQLREWYGDGLGDPLGSIRLPASRQGARTPLHAVTPAMIRQAGTQLDVDLYEDGEPNVALAQYLTTLRAPSPVTGKPLISDQVARRKLKASADVDRDSDRIDDEALAALPPVQQQRHLARLDAQLDEAMEVGDDESAADLMIAIAEISYLHDLAMQSGEAAPTGGAADVSGQSTPPAPAMPTPPPPAMPGNSLTEMGIGVGAEGGRPLGSSPEPITPVGPPRSGRA